MARVVYIRNPSQPDDCLSGAMGAYIARIPPRFAAFSDAVAYLSRAKFEADDGKSGDDSRCYPAQRARVWPTTFNCWEATAHLVAEGARLLPADWILYVHDQTFGPYRHVWATLEFPGLLGGVRPVANLSGNDVLGGLHVAGRMVLSAFGAGGVGDALEGAEGDALPDWARNSPKKNETKESSTTADSDDVPPKKSTDTKKKESKKKDSQKPGAKNKDTPQGRGIDDPI